jgi:hypothetical protein
MSEDGSSVSSTESLGVDTDINAAVAAAEAAAMALDAVAIAQFDAAAQFDTAADAAAPRAAAQVELAARVYDLRDDPHRAAAYDLRDAAAARAAVSAASEQLLGDARTARTIAEWHRAAAAATAHAAAFAAPVSMPDAAAETSEQLLGDARTARTIAEWHRAAAAATAHAAAFAAPASMPDAAAETLGQVSNVAMASAVATATAAPGLTPDAAAEMMAAARAAATAAPGLTPAAAAETVNWLHPSPSAADARAFADQLLLSTEGSRGASARPLVVWFKADIKDFTKFDPPPGGGSTNMAAFLTWNMKFVAALRRSGLEKIVACNAITYLDVPDSVRRDSKAATEDVWSKSIADVASLLVLLCGDEPLHIMEVANWRLDHGVIMYAALRNYFAPSNASNAGVILKTIVNTKFDVDADLSAHVTYILRSAIQLSRVQPDMALSDSQLRQILLDSFPTGMEPLVVLWTNTPTLSGVLDKINEHHNRRSLHLFESKAMFGGAATASAPQRSQLSLSTTTARQGSHGRGRGRGGRFMQSGRPNVMPATSRRFSGACYGCGQIGHLQRDCPHSQPQPPLMQSPQQFSPPPQQFSPAPRLPQQHTTGTWRQPAAFPAQRECQWADDGFTNYGGPGNGFMPHRERMERDDNAAAAAATQSSIFGGDGNGLENGGYGRVAFVAGVNAQSPAPWSRVAFFVNHDSTDTEGNGIETTAIANDATAEPLGLERIYKVTADMFAHKATPHGSSQLSADAPAWVMVDTGAAGYISSHPADFASIDTAKVVSLSGVFGSGRTLGSGIAAFNFVADDGGLHPFTTHEGTLVPNSTSAGVRLVGVGTLGRCDLSFDSVKHKMTKADGTSFTANYDGDHYWLKILVPTSAPALRCAGVALSNNLQRLWHKRCMHRDVRRLFQTTVGGGDFGVVPKQEPGQPFCWTCAAAKARQAPRGASQALRRRSLVPWQDVQLDVAHLSLPVCNIRYILAVVDLCTRSKRHYFLSCLLGASVQVKVEALVEYIKGRGFELKTIRTDGAKYFVEGALQVYLHEKGIRHEMSAAYFHHEVGVVENSNLVTFDAVRAIMHERNVPRPYLLQAVSMVDFVTNRLPHASNKDYMSPHECETGQKPSVSSFRVPFSVGFLHLQPNMKRHKDLDNKGEECILLGYNESSPMYTVLTCDKKVRWSADVRFDESSYSLPAHYCTALPLGFLGSEPKPMASGAETYHLESQTAASFELPTLELPTLELHTLETATLERPLPSRLDVKQPLRFAVEEPFFVEEQPPPEQPPPGLQSTQSPTSRPKRAPKPKDHFVPENPPGGARRWGTSAALGMTALLGLTLLVGVAQTINIDKVRQQHARSYLDGPDRQPVVLAMNSEYTQICKRGTFVECFVTAAEAAALNVLTLKWVIKEKLKDDGTRDKFKARLVVRGFAQRKGVDYYDTFAPTARVETVRWLVAFATATALLLLSGDVTGAYLNGVLEEAVYCYEPQGFTSPHRSDGLTTIWRLCKSLYGLKQAGRIWYQLINGAFLDFGFRRSTADPCLYTYQRNGVSLFCALYVDNVISAASELSIWKKFISFCGKRFELVDLGELRHELGVVFEKGVRGSRPILFLQQSSFVADLLGRWNVGRQPRAQPCQKELLRRPTEGDQLLVEPELSKYRKIVGSLVWLAYWTRIDIVLYVVFCCTYMHAPCHYHLKVALQILDYLSGTVSYGITYQQGDTHPVAWCDADWIGPWTPQAESIVSTIIMYGGAAVFWTCSKSDNAKLSSTEAEICATWTAVPGIISLRQLLEDVGSISDKERPPTQLFIDNQGTVNAMSEPIISKKNKHIRAKYWRARQEKDLGTILPVKIHTKLNLANYLTKPVGGSEAIRDRRILMNIVVH